MKFVLQTSHFTSSPIVFITEAIIITQCYILSVRYCWSHDWKAGTVAKLIGGRLYDTTLADGSTHRVHANQMRLWSIQLTEDYFAEFANTFNPPIRARKLPMEKLDTWTNMQWTTNRPAFSKLQLWTTANRSSQAAHYGNPAVLNKVTFQRNHLSWTQEGKRTSIHKLIPVVQVVFFWFF